MDDTHSAKPTLTGSIERGEGVTQAEHYLKQLCDRSFLSLWSHPRVFRDQWISPTSQEGKEVCDLLVVFREHIIIFSDKDTAFSKSGNLDVQWERWYRKAVKEAAKQIWGAERWIRDHPNRLFLDSKCSQPFPIILPALSTAIFHGIIVAHGASQHCKEALGGNGSLRIDPNRDDLFTIGPTNQKKRYVHVLDDISLDVVMSTLDTITDFVEYLMKKEQLIQSGRFGSAEGEEDLLAFYLRHRDRNGGHGFPLPQDGTKLTIPKGEWNKFSSRRKKQIEWNQVSYAWDSLIEGLNKHILAGTHYAHLIEMANAAVVVNPAIVVDPEPIMRWFAGETRLRRRILVKTILERLDQARSSQKIIYRFVHDPLTSDKYPTYVFLIHPRHMGELSKVDRTEWQKILCGLLLVAKQEHSDAQHILGMIVEEEREQDKFRIRDTAYLDARIWSSAPEYLTFLQGLRKAAGLLENQEKPVLVAWEYPAEATSIKQNPDEEPKKR